MGIRSDLVAATRRAICDAALHLFVERGVAATKVDDILKASGMSVGSFYYLFKNKIDLASNLYLETQQQFMQSLLKELSQHEEAQMGIEALVRAYLHWAADHPTEMYYLAYSRESEFVEMADEREKASETDFFAQLDAWLQPHIHRGEVRRLDAKLCFALWLGPAAYLVQNELGKSGAFLKLPEYQLREHLLASEELLAEAAWHALKAM